MKEMNMFALVCGGLYLAFIGFNCAVTILGK